MRVLSKILRSFQIRNVNGQIFALVIVTITIPLLILSGVIYYHSVEAVKAEYEQSSNLILNNLSFNIDQYLHSIETGTLTAFLNSDLQAALEHWASQNSGQSYQQSVQYQTIIENFVSSIEMTIKNVDSVQIYVGDRVFYSVHFNRSDYEITEFTKQPWYQRTMERKGNIVIFGTHKPFHRVNAQFDVISIARVINKVGTKQPLGVLLIDIRLDSLREILSMSETTNRKFLIIDDQGAVVYSSTHQELMGHHPEILEPATYDYILSHRSGSHYAPVSGVESYINFVTSPYSGWKVIQYIEVDEIIKHAQSVQKIVLLLAISSLGTAILFLFILYRRATKPIIFLSNQVRKVGMGKFDVDLSTKRRDEFGVLYQGIAKMVSDLQEYIERSSRAKVQQKIAQYGALKSQINPHFLANALESIQMKAVINKQREIGEMVGLVGRLFRSYTQTGKDMVTLQQELDHTRLYVQIQQIRFGDKIQYREELAPGSESAQMLHFSLQPLIENAIVHGLERKTGPGRLEIITEISEKVLTLVVRDDGLGMDEKQLQAIRVRLRQPSDTLEEEHIGLKNVHDRIRFYFGDTYGLEVDSEPGRGTAVKMKIPLMILK